MTMLLVVTSLLVMLVLSPLLLVRSLSPSLNDDVLGLIVFKADLQDPYGKLVSWNEDEESACNWVGVKCDPRSNRVSELNLDGFSLSGRISRGILQLGLLQKLSLSKNNLTGGISSGLAQLPNLRYVNLSENNLSGAIPDDFFLQCGSLRSISLAGNKFSGAIPTSISSCSTLAGINLSSNQFSGSIPSGITSLKEMRSLDLSDNMLEGEMPKGFEALINLRTIVLRKNRLSGNIPDGIGSCLLLRLIDFSENTLSGSIPDKMKILLLCKYLNLGSNLLTGEAPTWIGNMRSLQTLDLSANKFSGPIPTSIGNLKSLKALKFSRNGFTGTLPESMSNCTNLEVIDIGQNSLTSKVPAWIFNLGSPRDSLTKSKLSLGISRLQYLDLSHNALNGEIPYTLGDSSNLHFLNLSRNFLAGALPTSIGQLKALVVLDLSVNQLHGIIPPEIGGAESLTELILERNILTGNIPVSLENCPSLTTLFLSGNSLTGPIPVAIAKLGNLQRVDLSANNLSGTIPKQLADLPYLLFFNISHNKLQGALPGGSFFNTISPSSVSGNPDLCGSAVNRSCPAFMPKPLVLNPNASTDPGQLPPTFVRKRITLSVSALIAIGAASVIFIGVIVITLLNLRVQSPRAHSAVALTLSGGDEYSSSPTTDANSGKLVMFSGDPDFSTGAHALLNKDCELGRGGFGAVYKTVLRDGHPVAIKKLTVSSLVKSQEDFEREVKKLGKIRHPNLVELEGYYWTPSLQLLISEFVAGGSLYKRLHEGPGRSTLSWNDRFNIILGTARSLAHLHQHHIIHYNLKSSNVLIGDSNEPKVGDFGLARLLPMLDRYVLSSKIQSALGYMAPEFACRTVKVTEKCDIYGFGVLVLEVITGKKPVEYMEDDVVVLCDMVREILEEGNAEECVDEKLHGKFPVEEAIPIMKLGLICTSHVPSNRPDMREVVNILELIRCPSDCQDESS